MRRLRGGEGGGGKGRGSASLGASVGKVTPVPCDLCGFCNAYLLGGPWCGSERHRVEASDSHRDRGYGEREPYTRCAGRKPKSANAVAKGPREMDPQWSGGEAIDHRSPGGGWGGGTAQGRPSIKRPLYASIWGLSTTKDGTGSQQTGPGPGEKAVGGLVLAASGPRLSPNS